jgi:hypothetical protein
MLLCWFSFGDWSFQNVRCMRSCFTFNFKAAIYGLTWAVVWIFWERTSQEDARSAPLVLSFVIFEKRMPRGPIGSDTFVFVSFFLIVLVLRNPKPNQTLSLSPTVVKRWCACASYHCRPNINWSSQSDGGSEQQSTSQQADYVIHDQTGLV